MNNLKRLFWTSSDLSNTSIQMSNLGQDNRAAEVWEEINIFYLDHIVVTIIYKNISLYIGHYL